MAGTCRLLHVPCSAPFPTTFSTFQVTQAQRTQALPFLKQAPEAQAMWPRRLEAPAQDRLVCKVISLQAQRGL